MTGAFKVQTSPGVWQTVGGGLSGATTAETVAGTSATKAVTPAGYHGALPHVDVRKHGVVADGVTDDSAAAQDAVDSLSGARGVIKFPIGTTLFNSDLDMKRAIIEGADPAPNSGGGGVVLKFAGTSKLYTSIEDNNGGKIRNVSIEGSASASPWTNGQTLVDLTGCNYPELHNVRIRKAQIGLKIANGGTCESHYGKFWLQGIQECNVGVEFGLLAHTHNFYGGRFWSCVKGVSIPSAVQNINFFGTAFECGSAAVAAVESTGTQINFFGVRWETTTTNLSVLSGAGEHWDFAPFHSSGFNYADANSPSVIYGYGRSSGVNERALTSAAPGGNLLRNGSFEYDTDADGIADGWTLTWSSAVVHAASLDVADFTHGLQSQLISNTSSNNLRLEQIFTVTPNVPYVLRGKLKTTRTSTFLRVGNGVSGANTYINQTLNLDGSGNWLDYAIGFTPTTAALNITIYLSGTGAGDVRADEMSLTQGMLSPAGYPVKAPLTDLVVAPYTQTYSTANKSLAAYTADVESGAYTGAADSEAKLADLNALRVAYENLRAFTEDAVQMLNSVVDDLQALGLLQ